MNPGLAFLLRATVRGFFRRIGRRMRTFRGFVATGFGILFFLVVVASQVMVLVLDPAAPAEHGRAVLAFSLALTALALPSLAAAEAPFFWPHEVHFLFPAPVSRRELLVYQMLGRGWVQLLSGAWLALFALRSATHPLAALAAVMLGVYFIFILSQLAGLLKVAAGDRVPRAVDAAVRPLLAVGAVAIGFVFYRRTRTTGLEEAIAAVLDAEWTRVVTLPLRPFGELYAARSLGEALAWGMGCVAILAVAFAAAASARVDFRERSLVSSARRFERLRRMRAGLAAPAKETTRGRRRIPVPELAFLGAAAPIARRQVVELGRGPRLLWSLLFSAGLAFFYVVVMPGWDEEPVRTLGATLVILVVVFPLLASGTVSIDFRRDLERMAYLRSLPCRPVSVAVGQVFTAAVVIALANLALLGIAVGTAGWRVDPRFALAAAAGAIPVAWLAVALENWLFLLFPVRTRADGGQQAGFLGKQLLKLFFKLVLLAVASGVAGVAAAAGAWIAGDAGAVTGVALVALATCIAATALLARAYRGFDLTVDSPA